MKREDAKQGCDLHREHDAFLLYKVLHKFKKAWNPRKALT